MNEPRQLTWFASLGEVHRAEAEIPRGYEFGSVAECDVVDLAELYLASYPRQIVAGLADALAEIERTFGGEYGDIDLASSPVVHRGGQLVGAVLTVAQAPWEDVPPGPFVIEVMVHPSHRRRGIARSLMALAAKELHGQGEETVGLRVMSSNEAAADLYRRLGFRSWRSDGTTRG